MENCTIGGQLFSSPNHSRIALTDLYDFSVNYSNVHGYLALTVCVFGIITNLVNIVVLTKPRMRSQINYVLTGIAICDMGTMLSYCIYLPHFTALNELNCNPQLFTYGWMLFLLCHMVVSITLHTSSLWFAVLVAGIRCSMLRGSGTRATSSMSMSMPNSLWGTVSTMLCVFILVASLCGPVLMSHSIVEYHGYMEATCGGFETDPIWSANATGDFTIVLSDFALAHNCLLMRITLWTNGIVFKVIPCLMLALCSVCLLITVASARKRRRRLTRNRRLTATSDHVSAMLTTILLVFLSMELPQGFVAIMSGLFPNDFHNFVYPAIADLIDLLSLINSNVTFFLYCFMSSKYRQTLRMVICPRYWLKNYRGKVSIEGFRTSVRTAADRQTFVMTAIVQSSEPITNGRC